VIDIHIDYAANDSCQIQLWARGQHEPAAFLAACETALADFDERQVILQGQPVVHEHWRTVEADAETKASGVCDYVHVKAQPGRGAYAVTVLNAWLPLFSEQGQVA
jgi:hypothetical protein